MKILLFNDNPVVRKLVALSAQKTKDDLSVVWSTDEIEDREYDLLIVDDALYSDEILDALKEKIALKSSLFMATRGKAVPSGFDHVINKPFLPTDLVDLFVQIEKKIGVVRANFFTSDEIYIQETSLFKLSSPKLLEHPEISKIIRQHSGNIVEVNPTYCIMTKDGMTEEILSLFKNLKKWDCILQYVRTGAIAITKSRRELLDEYLKERQSRYKKSKSKE